MDKPTIHRSNTKRRSKTGKSNNNQRRSSTKKKQPPSPVRHRPSSSSRISKEFSSFPEDIPKSCLINILSYMNGNELRQVEQVCRKFRVLCNNNPNTNIHHHHHHRIRTIQIRCITKSWKNLFHKLDFLNNQKHMFSSRRGYHYKLQLLVDLDKFKKLSHRGNHSNHHDNLEEEGNAENTTTQKKKHSIISGIRQLEILDRSVLRSMSTSGIGNNDGGTSGSTSSARSRRGVFSRLSITSSTNKNEKKKIDEIDKAKVIASRPVLSRFVMIAPNIEQISWKGHRYAMSILGDTLKSLRNLRGIYMSNSIFYTDEIVVGSKRSIKRRTSSTRNNNNNNNMSNNRRQGEGSIDNPQTSSYRIFQYCSQNLVHVDILNCKVQKFCWATGTAAEADAIGSSFSPASSNLIACYKSEPIPQEALMEFVRRTPTLRWFRSDLIPLNIHILKEERPEVNFISL